MRRFYLLRVLKYIATTVWIILGLLPLFMGDFAAFFWMTVILMGPTYGIPYYKKKRTAELIRNQTKEQPLFLCRALHQTEGKGYLAVTKQYVAFVQKQNVYGFPFEQILSMGTKNQGTGHFSTIHTGGLFHTSSTSESKVPAFYISGTDANQEVFEQLWMVPTHKEADKFYHHLHQTGKFESAMSQYKI